MIDIDDFLISIDSENLLISEKENPSMDDILFSLINEKVFAVMYKKKYNVDIFDMDKCTIVYDTNKNCYYCNFLLDGNDSDIIQNISCNKEIGVVFGSDFKYRHTLDEIKSIPMCHLIFTPVFLSIALYETPEPSIEIQISYDSIILNCDLRKKIIENQLTSNNRIFGNGMFIC
jgi:hypothetical protein